MTKEEDVTESKFDNLEGMLEDLWNATVEDLCNATESEDWYDIPSDEMTLEQARQAVKYLRKKLAEYLKQQSILDKVRAEIIELRNKQNVGVLECLDIIDKYINESEVEDTNRQFDFPFSIFNKEMLLEKEKYFREEAEKAGMSLNEYLEKMSKEVEE